MKKFFHTLALTSALIVPALAVATAKPVTLTANLKNYGGKEAYLVVYVTDPNGNYAGSLWMSGGKSKYYKHLSGWYRATGGNSAEVSGITGASVGSGRSLKLKLDLADTLFDAGYKLHIDTAVEDMRDGPNDISVPLTTEGAGQAVKGKSYISKFTYSL